MIFKLDRFKQVIFLSVPSSFQNVMFINGFIYCIVLIIQSHICVYTNLNPKDWKFESPPSLSTHGVGGFIDVMQ